MNEATLRADMARAEADFAASEAASKPRTNTTPTPNLPGYSGATTYSDDRNAVTVYEPGSKWKECIRDAFGNLTQVTEPISWSSGEFYRDAPGAPGAER